MVGGGYIGLELGTFFSSLGTEVTVVEMLPGLLEGVDRDLAGVLKKRLDQKFRSIMLETKLASLSELGNEVQVLFEADGKSFGERYEKVLISVGRVPYTEGLGLENTRVGVDGKGLYRDGHPEKNGRSGDFRRGRRRRGAHACPQGDV